MARPPHTLTTPDATNDIAVPPESFTLPEIPGMDIRNRMDAEPVYSGPLTELDRNGDLRITRSEMRAKNQENADAIRRADCESVRHLIPHIESIGRGLTDALTDRSPQVRAQAEQRIATHLTNKLNSELEAEDVREHFSRGIETARPSDAAFTARAAGERLRSCGLTGSDAPAPSRESSGEVEIAHNAPRGGRPHDGPTR
ncbi:MAG: hypothetical protein C0436_04390 [Alphaproteobacteria bacterium]|nr:hypothetical protein [Alphaproteobacteria bacterium]